MARVAAGDPDVLAARHRPDERLQIRRRAPDARPPVRHPRPGADELLGELLDLRLHELRRRLHIGLLGGQGHVAATADHEPAIRQLMPVVETAAGIVRPLVPAFRQRLGDQHLTARRADDTGELGQEPRREPIPCHDDDVGSELVDADRLALAHVGPCRRCVRGETPDPARGLERPVGRVVDRAGVERVERRSQSIDPFDGEPVLLQRIVLAPQRLALRLVDGKPQAADAPECVARELGQPVERPLGELHQPPGVLCTQQTAGLVVRRRRAAQRESTVAAAGAARDLARLVEPDAHTALGEGQSARAPGHATADHRHLGATLEAPPR